MKNPKGFTLVEIIVAIGLLGVISTGFLGVMSNNYEFLFETKEITERAFEAQQDMELGIDQAKALIASPGHGGLSMNTIEVFEDITVSYFALENSYEQQNYYTLVSETRVPTMPKLNISGVKASLRYNTTTTKYLYPLVSANIQGSYINDPLTLDDLLTNVYEWYVSKEGFNIPVPSGNSSSFYYLNDMPEIEIIDRYPIFPSDFALIGTATSDSLPDLTGYSGRHIIFTATPGAKSGKLGNKGISSPVFVNGLNQTNNLILHLDASYVDPYNSSEVVSSVDRKVIKINDISSNINNATPTEFSVQSDSIKRPELKDTDIVYSFGARYMRFTNGKMFTFDNQGALGKQVDYYAVVRGNNAVNEEILFVNGSSVVRVIEDADKKIQNDGWYIVSGSYTSSSNSFVIGNDDIDLIELIVYVDGSSQSDVENYLRKKYLPVDNDAVLLSLYNLSSEIFAGESYVLPQTAVGDFSVGDDRFVQIVWNDMTTIDTSVPGTVTRTGHWVNDENITITLTLVIKPIPVTSVTLAPATLTLIEGGTTGSLTPTVLPANATYPQVTWSTIPSNSTVASVMNGVVTPLAPGTVTIRATSVSDNTKYGETVITVKSQTQIIQEELNAALSSITTLTVNNANNRNTATNKPTIITPSDNSGGNGIYYTFTSSTAGSGAAITIQLPNRKSAIVTRGSNDRTGTITLTATKSGNISTKVFNVTIPREKSNPGTITAVQ